VDDDPRLARQSEAIALMRDLGERMQAERVAVLLDLGDGGAATLEWEPDRAPPPTTIVLDVVQEEIIAPVGVVAAFADGVLELARALGGRSVASVDFPTRDPALPLTVAAREGEGVVLATGDVQFAY